MLSVTKVCAKLNLVAWSLLVSWGKQGHPPSSRSHVLLKSPGNYRSSESIHRLPKQNCGLCPSEVMHMRQVEKEGLKCGPLNLIEHTSPKSRNRFSNGFQVAVYLVASCRRGPSKRACWRPKLSWFGLYGGVQRRSWTEDMGFRGYRHDIGYMHPLMCYWLIGPPTPPLVPNGCHDDGSTRYVRPRSGRPMRRGCTLFLTALLHEWNDGGHESADSCGIEPEAIERRVSPILYHREKLHILLRRETNIA